MGLAITALFGFVSGILSYGLFVPSDLKPFNLLGVAGSMSGYALGTQAKNFPGWVRAILIIISAVATVACIVSYVIYVQRGTGEAGDVILLAIFAVWSFFHVDVLDAAGRSAVRAEGTTIGQNANCMH